MIEELLPFQREFLAAVDSPAYDTEALSGPRGLGKSALAAHVLERCLTPGDSLHQPGKEYILGAASLEQARLTYSFLREWLEPCGQYRFIDGTTRLGITHLPSNTKLRAISSNAKTAFGLVNVPLVVLDEPGALEIVGGQLLSDALFTAQAKVNSPLQIILIGTLGPMATVPGHWWYDLVHAGTTRKTYVKVFQGDLETWDKWPTIRKANPLIARHAETRAKVLEERDAARKDSRLKARFMTYRLNVPSADESQVLLTVDDYKAMIARDTPERSGRPVVAVDLGSGRAWSAAVAAWPTGRVEALALAPGLPDLEAQEIRDLVPAGTYRKLYDSGRLAMADGLRVQPPAMLWDMVQAEWGRPRAIICDRFRLAEMEDAVKGKAPIEPRVYAME